MATLHISEVTTVMGNVNNDAIRSPVIPTQKTLLLATTGGRISHHLFKKQSISE